nr:uncharacterized protein LOC109159167 [Ipomoea batatas]
MLELFQYLFSIPPIPEAPGGGGFLCIQSRGHFCKICNTPDFPHPSPARLLSVKYPWSLLVDHEWPTHVTEHKYPAETRALNNAAIKISVEAYECDIFRSAEEYSNAKLEPPRYDLTEKYTPKRAVVTVAVGPPPSGPSSSTTMRSFPVSARLPAPSTRINLGSKKNELPKTRNSGVEALIPTRLPLMATHPASPSGEKETSWTA